MKSWIKYGAIVSAMAFGAFALSEQIGELPNLIEHVHFGLLGGVLLGLLVYQIWNASVWSEVLSSIYETGKKRTDCARIWLESESLKWLPGSVWSYGSRVVLADEIGVTKKKASSSIILELIMTNIAWASLALTTLFTFPVSAWFDKVESYLNWVIFAILGLLVFGIVVSFAFFKIKKLRAVLSIGPIDFKKCLATIFHYIVLCVFNGLLFYGVMTAVPNVEVPVVAALSIAGVAWLAGFWAIGIPGGIGVRETVIVAMVCQFSSLEQAILVAALWRGCQMLAEVGAISLMVGTGIIKQAKPKLKEDESSKKEGLSY
ncbi:lysylphosphatidylglycerol synthase domain-containing protein [Rubritalea spongiae]|uniref:Lysylphosphatidylglycerol synthase domain-containing protein n=1 Tax=Rubritalea spongiae TaxID=430797 RepID=A0ABW5E2D4_9BACT